MSTKKVAVTYEDGEVYQHFGHTKTFKIYHIQENAVVSSSVVSSGSYGHGSLATFLAQMGVSVLICGGIGGGAVNALSNENIQIYAGAEGNADQCVADFLAGKVEPNAHANCSHHEHDHNHGCGGANFEHNCETTNHDHDCIGHNKKL